VYTLSLTECCKFLYYRKIGKDNIKQIPNITMRTIHGIFLADKPQVSWFDPVSTIPVMLHSPHSFIHLHLMLHILPTDSTGKYNKPHTSSTRTLQLHALNDTEDTF
jgi:hypothetical protein